MTIYYTYIECASNFIKDLDVYRCLRYEEVIKTGLISITTHLHYYYFYSKCVQLTMFFKFSKIINTL